MQSSTDGLLWETAAVTLKCSERIAGYLLGEPRWFRVVARNSVGTAEPSGNAAIYAPASARVALKLAA